jgi:hypothetical protein
MLFAQDNTISFYLDLSAHKVDNPEEVGLRGSKAPLSWEKSYAMKDEGNGIYRATVEFENLKPGEKVEYKYVHGDVIWENDELGPFGNREVRNDCGCKKQVKKVDKWNELDKFTSKAVSSNCDMNNFQNWVYIISSAQKRGLSAEQAGAEYASFWTDNLDWLKSPQQWMAMDRLNAEASANSNFRSTKNENSKVAYEYNNAWASYIGEWGKDGRFKGISEEDLNSAMQGFLKRMCKAKNWDCKLEERDNKLSISLENRQATKGVME